MERLRINLNNDHSVGLGDNLCLLSSLANIPPPIDLYVNNVHNTFDRLTHYKKIFRIPNTQLQIFFSEDNGDFNNVGWPVKLFSEYYRPQFVSINGQTIQTRTRSDKDKKFIAIAGSTIPDETGLNEWPSCRARPQEYWNRIYGWIKNIGYEAVSVDNPFVDLEDKIEILAKHCRAIISYEGGMAHLSHMLKLPCFLVDWKHPSPSTELADFHCDFVHKSRSVYILRNDEEIFSWGEGQFNQMVERLHIGETNNRLVNRECRLQFAGPGIHGKISVVDNHTGKVLLTSTGMFGNNQVSALLNQYYLNQVAQK
jgi:hypothetical protein